MAYEPSVDFDDVTVDDIEFVPGAERGEPKSSKAWLNLIKESQEAFERWNEVCDQLDRLYANLDQLANKSRDRQFQLFWANCEVLKPSIYAKPPVPVVVPKFKDRRPLYQAASELAERCAVVAFDVTRVHDVMTLLRDDVALIGRGVPWVRYESGKRKRPEKVCIEWKARKDFLHSLSRCWPEVTWVAVRAHMTRAEARERFEEFTGALYEDADYKVDKDAREIGGTDDRERAEFWEIWSRTYNKVVWVAEGCERILDEDEPHLDLQHFWPCPMPAYGTLQRGSLVPVPDILQYKDQLDEINILTGRIHALSDSVEAVGFYPSGAAELADAIETAVKTHSTGTRLIPVSNWAAFGGSKEVIVWLPIEAIANVVTAAVGLRKQIIEDVYQLTGLSDIMRGATDPRETMGAQQLKSQYGSSRIRDKQAALVRVARDLVEITVEIIAKKFSQQTMIDMSQCELPTKEQLDRQVQQALQEYQQNQQQLMQMAQSPQAQQMMQKNPEGAQQAMQEAQGHLQEMQQDIFKLRGKPTVEQVVKFLRDNSARAFVLDIETDSTIQLDENAEKQRRSEALMGLAQLLPQIVNLISVAPEAAEVGAGLLKFGMAPFRASRALDGSIDQLADIMMKKAQSAGKNQKPEPLVEAAKVEAKTKTEQLKYQKEKDDADREVKKAEIMAKNQLEREKAKGEVLLKNQESNAKTQQIQMKGEADARKEMAEAQGRAQEAALAQEEHGLKRDEHAMKREDMQMNMVDRQQARVDAKEVAQIKAAASAKPPGGIF